MYEKRLGTTVLPPFSRLKPWKSSTGGRDEGEGEEGRRRQARRDGHLNIQRGTAYRGFLAIALASSSRGRSEVETTCFVRVIRGVVEFHVLLAKEKDPTFGKVGSRSQTNFVPLPLFPAREGKKRVGSVHCSEIFSALSLSLSLVSSVHGKKMVAQGLFQVFAAEKFSDARRVSFRNFVALSMKTSCPSARKKGQVS